MSDVEMSNGEIISVRELRRRAEEAEAKLERVRWITVEEIKSEMTRIRLDFDGYIDYESMSNSADGIMNLITKRIEGK